MMQSLHPSNNHLVALPESFGRFEALQVLHFDGNPVDLTPLVLGRQRRCIRR